MSEHRILSASLYEFQERLPPDHIHQRLLYSDGRKWYKPHEFNDHDFELGIKFYCLEFSQCVPESYEDLQSLYDDFLIGNDTVLNRLLIIEYGYPSTIVVEWITGCAVPTRSKKWYEIFRARPKWFEERIVEGDRTIPVWEAVFRQVIARTMLTTS